MVVPFFIFDGTTGDPVAGLSPTFNFYKRREANGSVTTLSPPSIVDKGGGLYEFTTVSGDAIRGTIIAYVIDCGLTALSRYQDGEINGDEAVADEVPPVTGSIEVFGVTYSTVRQDYFPQFTSEWSATSNPTASTVSRWIADAAASLSGRLMLKSMTAAGIASGVDPDDPTDAYAWCRQTVALTVALRAVPVMWAGGNVDLEKQWRDELTARYELLEEHGATALGNGATASGDSPEGPTSHISQLNLDTGDSSDASDVVPKLRRSDQL